MITIKLTGEQKLQARLLKIKTEKSLFRFATREGAKLVAAKVRQDLPSRTGFLKKNVKVRSAGKKKLGASVIVGFPGEKDFYGMPINQGSVPRFQKRSGRYTGRLPKKDYVAKAAIAVATKCGDEVCRIIAAKIFG